MISLIDDLVAPTRELAGLVHGDFRLANILFGDDIARGVIDIEALRSALGNTGSS